MHKPTTSIMSKVHNEELSEHQDFLRDYAHYKHLFDEMDGITTISGKRLLFRRLSGLLNRMEISIRSQGEET